MQQRILPLAALLQGLRQIRRIAETGQAEANVLSAMLNSIFELEADSVAAVYGGLPALRPGLLLLRDYLTSQGKDPQLPKLTLSVLQIERRYSANEEMDEKVHQGILVARHLVERHASATHPEVLTALGEQMPEGVWVGTRYWYGAHDNARNVKFVGDFKARYGMPPSYNAEGAYAAVYALKTAMEKAGSPDNQAIATALRGMSVDTPAGTVTFRAGDNQALIGPTWGKTGPMNPEDKIRSLVNPRTFDGAAVTLPLDQTGCTLS